MSTQASLTLKNLFFSNVRIGRLGFWYSHLILLSILAVVLLIDNFGSVITSFLPAKLSHFDIFLQQHAVLSNVLAVLGWSLLFVVLIVSFYTYKRRLNDLNNSGWCLLWMLVPLVNLYWVIKINFFRGTSGDNSYGDEKLKLSRSVHYLSSLFFLVWTATLASGVFYLISIGGSSH